MCIRDRRNRPAIALRNAAPVKVFLPRLPPFFLGRGSLIACLLYTSWVDFLDTYWHVDCVRKMSCNAFTLHYQKWCCRKKYNFSRLKAEEIYETAKELIPVLPKDDFTKRIIKQAIQQLNAASQTVEQLRILMNETAAKLPEYPIVMAMKGVGPSLGPQLMAEIGDVARFTHKGAITAFAGADPGVNDSGRCV